MEIGAALVGVVVGSLLSTIGTLMVQTRTERKAELRSCRLDLVNVRDMAWSPYGWREIENEMAKLWIRLSPYGVHRDDVDGLKMALRECFHDRHPAGDDLDEAALDDLGMEADDEVLSSSKLAEVDERIIGIDRLLARRLRLGQSPLDFG